MSSGGIYAALSGVTFLSAPAPVETTAPPEETGSGSAITYGNYTPGIYEATVYGFESDIVAVVEVSATEIVSLKINATGESKIGIDAVKVVKDVILQEQTAEVDAVSGATWSSQAAIDAVKEALGQASAG
ncbi:hypothetical protein SDC9_121390 [bioreactor metagenome]|uniref:FMN-binding domain-containing protein n=1 Tax=bioreactor metagenome TaxID=1076179 RepID=A0A645CBZ3_9ZZZZ